MFWIFTNLITSWRLTKKQQAKKLPRGAAGVAYGKPAHLLDAPQYSKLAWDAISVATIKNAFNKSQLLTLRGGADEVVDLMAELLRSFEALNFQVGECAIEEFIYIDNENNEVFSQEILDDVNDVLG